MYALFFFADLCEKNKSFLGTLEFYIDVKAPNRVCVFLHDITEVPATLRKTIHSSHLSSISFLLFMNDLFSVKNYF